MGYIRNREEELTGYQAGDSIRPSVDLQCDFVMVYGIDETMADRVREYQEMGYVVHLMTGIAWGEYRDFLDGEWDGRKHWDEGQQDRDGQEVNHNPAVPYMVPSIAFADYLTEKLKVAVDAGVAAIHVEEPEFWDKSGYSEGFKREYEIFYRDTWKPQHESLDARYRTAKLKTHLYCRTIERISAALKEYAKVLYGRELRFYVPTHSLLNYTQWKILSPEAALNHIPTVDGYIAQVWTGTSREANVYEGVYRERTFETAYLEYGVMQELVQGTERRMWFLNDPIEDAPCYTWDNYRYNYLKTAVASLLHPHVWHYEICPWPHRVFDGAYPIEDAKPIPQTYSTLLSGMFQLFGDMKQDKSWFEGSNCEVGVFMSDSGLFQRAFPDGIIHGDGLGTRLSDAKHKNSGNEVDEEKASALMREIEHDDNLMLDFIQSVAFPNFFGLAMPLVKYGLPVKPVQLDNVRRFAEYLTGYKYLILSYEYMKPEAPDINTAVLSWVNQGGTLIYIGDGTDPYHRISSWWKKAGYDNPARHLFAMAGLGAAPDDGSYQTGTGNIIVWNMQPARICLSKNHADQYRSLVKQALIDGGNCWEYTNHLTVHRGPYIISSVMEESVTGNPKIFDGLYADMTEPDYKITTHKVIAPDQGAILFDFAEIEGEAFRVIGTSARINQFDKPKDGFVLKLKTADKIKAYTRLRLPCAVLSVRAVDETGMDAEVNWNWDIATRTLLISYVSSAKELTLNGIYERG